MATRLGPGDYRDVPWKNGGGTTRELIKLPHPHDPARFFVRLSIATVASSGPFSSFPGVDRTLVLLDGDGMALSFGGGPAVTLDRPLRPLAFPGEVPCEATLLGGPTRDFNLMVDRAVGGASLRIVQLALGRDVPTEAHDLLVIHVLAGDIYMGRNTVSAGETLLVESEGESFGGHDSVAIVVRVWRHDDPRSDSWSVTGVAAPAS